MHLIFLSFVNSGFECKCLLVEQLNTIRKYTDIIGLGDCFGIIGSQWDVIYAKSHIKYRNGRASFNLDEFWHISN